VAWFGILKALVLAIGSFASWLRNRQLTAAGRAETIAADLDSMQTEAATAQKAREAVRVALGREPERLRDDDGFKRPD
jgi:Tfp pilus assembly protein FimT